jgi:oligoendopeptidase F
MANSQSANERESIETKYKWNLKDIYPTMADWQKAKEDMKALIDKFETYKGRLGSSASVLLEYLEFSSNFDKEFGRIYSYASMCSDQDIRDASHLAMTQELKQLYPVIGSKTAFAEPELLELGKDTIDKFLLTEPRLGVFRMYLYDLLRKKEHLLSEAEERILAQASSMASSPYSIFNVFMNSEMPFPQVTLSTGETVTLNQAGFARYRTVPDAADRELVFTTFWTAVGKFQRTLAEQLLARMNVDVFNTRTRKYASSLESSLDKNNIPVSVYHSLIDNINKCLPVFHRYLGLRKRMLGLDVLKYSDMYTPVVKDLDLKYTFDDARKLVVASLEPLGKDYQSVIERAFDERWMDVYPSTGKRSGAYSNGSVYDIHPYILLNFNGMYEDVSTTTHELGHTMQSYLSNKTQPFPLAHYPIFVAEVASTFNELLLNQYMVRTIDNPDVRLSLLMSRLDGFKGTLFRQTQFAEFELAIHQKAEAGEPLTNEALNNLYGSSLKRYYGHEQGVCEVSDLYSVEWSYIPHFYYNFYVYQYATSFTASVALAEKVLAGEKGSVERYMEFLSAGGSDYPIELLKRAGVDMTTSEPFEKAMQSMQRIMDEIEQILK